MFAAAATASLSRTTAGVRLRIMRRPVPRPQRMRAGRRPSALLLTLPPSMTRPARQPPPAPEAREQRDQHLAGLLAASAAGNAAAFESFYEATFAYARTVARRLLRDNAAVEDLLADCYFEAWRSAARFDAARGSAVTWLLTLVRSRGVDALRAAAARPDRASAASTSASADAAAFSPDERAPPADLAGGSDADRADAADPADPAERLWRREAGAELHAALAALTSPERWVLGLAYLRELSHAEIARCTGMPLGTVKSHALRAQNKLRQRFGLPPSGRRDALHATS